jgi:hypothetical protein
VGDDGGGGDECDLAPGEPGRGLLLGPEETGRLGHSLVDRDGTGALAKRVYQRAEVSHHRDVVLAADVELLQHVPLLVGDVLSVRQRVGAGESDAGLDGVL